MNDFNAFCEAENRSQNLRASRNHQKYWNLFHECLESIRHNDDVTPLQKQFSGKFWSFKAPYVSKSSAVGTQWKRLLTFMGLVIHWFMHAWTWMVSDSCSTMRPWVATVLRKCGWQYFFTKPCLKEDLIMSTVQETLPDRICPYLSPAMFERHLTYIACSIDQGSTASNLISYECYYPNRWNEGQLYIIDRQDVYERRQSWTCSITKRESL